MSRLERIKAFGNIIERPVDSRRRTYWVGYFTDRNYAEDVLRMVRQEGYRDAFIRTVDLPKGNGTLASNLSADTQIVPAPATPVAPAATPSPPVPAAASGTPAVGVAPNRPTTAPTAAATAATPAVVPAPATTLATTPAGPNTPPTAATTAGTTAVVPAPATTPATTPTRPTTPPTAATTAATPAVVPATTPTAPAVPAGAPTASTEEPFVVDVRGLRYKIQLGAYQRPENVSFSGVADIGTIQMRRFERGVIVYLGDYLTADAARVAQQSARAQGFTQAFVVAFNNGQRVSLDEAARLQQVR